MLTPPRNWETKRIIARPATRDAAPVIFDDYATDPDVAKYMTWGSHRALDETLEFLDRCERVWLDGSAYPWTLWLKSSGEFLGMCEIRVRGHAVDLGYALSRRWWRQGLMSEAVQSLVQWALSEPDIVRVWAVCDVDNPRSARVLERVGMQREGILRRWSKHPNISERARDCFCYSIVKSN
jgi:ribosomal-protein-alanine N-acetyltransferase